MPQLPIADFLTARLKEYDATFELRQGTGFAQLFFKPMQFIVQPFRDEATDISIGQSFNKILAQDDPNAFDESAVDALSGNLFVDRKTGGKGGGVARAYYEFPVDREYPTSGAMFSSGNGVQFSNTAPFKISSPEMSLNIEDGSFFFDIPVLAVTEGSSGSLKAGELVALENDPDVVRVTNKEDFSPGSDKEVNIDYITRSQQAIGVRDLVAGKGFRAILFENFVSSLAEVQPIGFGDQEMMRDIVYNTHIGGRVDGYVKTYTIQTGHKDIIGLLIDDTRQSFTTSNVQLFGTDYTNVGNPNIDRTGGKNPIVQEIKPSEAAIYTSPVDLSSPVNLAAAQFIRIGVDGVYKDVRVAGVVPGATNRNEIVTLINTAFGINVAFAYNNTIRLRSPTEGLSSQLVFTQPLAGTSGLLSVLGLSPFGAPYTYSGDGPVTFIEGVNFETDDGNGAIRRIVGASVLATQTTGETGLGSDLFVDVTTNIFLNVAERDILTISSGPDAGDYRILGVLLNQLTLDAELTTTLTGVSYSITRTGIKSGEIVYVQYFFNPVSVDIGNMVKLDVDGITRGIRPGRDDLTITDLAFLRITSVQYIDALSHEPTGEVLDGNGGFGQGGYGQGAYGIGQGSDYYIVVNSPHERYSAFEDSYIIFRNGLQGESIRINYEYVPEVVEYHNFVRGESERVLDGDILIKHFIPAYVSTTVQYSQDPTDSSLPDAATLTASAKHFIDTSKSNTTLQASDIEEFILSQIDPYKKYNAHIKPFTLTGRIHNVNGAITGIQSNDELTIPTLDPFPKDTTQPLSPKITHWMADEIVMEQL